MVVDISQFPDLLLPAPLPNDVFQTVFLKFLTLACDTPEGQRIPETPGFQSILVPFALSDPDDPLNTPL